MISREITINARKFDGSVHRSWTADLVTAQGSFLLFLGRFENDVTHPDLGFIRRGTFSYEYYWLDRWYNVFRFHEPEGTFRNFYCNINRPPEFDGRSLNYVDLDIDVLVTADGTLRTLDMDEFEENAKRFAYPQDIRNSVSLALEELLLLIKTRDFPFELEQYLSGPSVQGGDSPGMA